MKTAARLFMICYRITALLVIMCAAVIVILFMLGIRLYVVKTGSMEPEIGVGSICFVDQRTDFREIREGDIIAFRVGEMLVTHRAVRISDEGITTQGDANNAEDAAKVTDGNFIGKTLFRVPYVGRVLLYAQYYGGKYIYIGAFVLYILLGLLYNRLKKDTENNGEETDEAAKSGEKDTEKSVNGLAP